MSLELHKALQSLTANPSPRTSYHFHPANADLRRLSLLCFVDENLDDLTNAGALPSVCDPFRRTIPLPVLQKLEITGASW